MSDAVTQALMQRVVAPSSSRWLLQKQPEPMPETTESWGGAPGSQAVPSRSWPPVPVAKPGSQMPPNIPEAVARLFGNDPANVQKAYDAFRESRIGRAQFTPEDTVAVGPNPGRIVNPPDSDLFRYMITDALEKAGISAAERGLQRPYSEAELRAAGHLGDQMYRRYTGTPL